MVYAMSSKGKYKAIYAIRVTARQEVNVALLMEAKAKAQNLKVYSILVPPDIKGYLMVEAPGIHVVQELSRDIKHVKGQVSGIVKFEEVERILKPIPIVEGISEGEIVEVIAGPFRGMRAQVVRVDRARNEVVLNILEAAYPLQVTVPADYVRPMKHGVKYG